MLRTTCLYLLFIARLGTCQVTLSDAAGARNKAINWLTSQWVEPREGVPVSRTGGWPDGSTSRVIMGLQLAATGSNWISDAANKPKAEIALRQMNSEILNALVRTANMTSIAPEEGAEYVSALMATCQNPSDFYGHNLVAMLTNRLLTVPSGPETKNVAQVIAGVTALCTARAAIPASLIQRINAELKPTSGGCPYCVEGASMAILAMKCVKDRPATGTPVDALVQGIMTRQIAYVKGKQEKDGGFGDLFATTLAVQAANAVGTVNLPINVASALSYILGDQDQTTGSFGGNLVLTALVLPALIGRSMLDAGKVQCPVVRALEDSPPPAGQIRVTIVVEDRIFVQRSIETRIITNAGQNILQVLNGQAARHPKAFQITTATMNGDTVLTGLNGLFNDNKNNWSWKVFRVPVSGGGQQPAVALDRVQVLEGDKVILRFGKP